MNTLKIIGTMKPEKASENISGPLHGKGAGEGEEGRPAGNKLVKGQEAGDGKMTGSKDKQVKSLKEGGSSKKELFPKVEKTGGGSKEGKAKDDGMGKGDAGGGRDDGSGEKIKGKKKKGVK
jgi:hypothetical protein